MTLTGLYSQTYPEVPKRMLELARAEPGRRVHGSALHDIVCEHFAGRRHVDSYDTERFLSDLVAAGALEVLECDPTVSQAAFAGLTYSRAGYCKLGWAPGVKTHYWYRLVDKDGT